MILRYQNACVLTLLACCATFASTQQGTPHAGYVYPAGGQQGTSFEVVVGGQFLNGVNAALITGNGAVSYTHLDVYKRQAIGRSQAQLALSDRRIGGDADLQPDLLRDGNVGCAPLEEKQLLAQIVNFAQLRFGQLHCGIR